MGFPIDPFTQFISNAPLANPPGASDMVPLIQSGQTKRVPITGFPGLVPVVIAPTNPVAVANYSVLSTDYFLPVRVSPAATVTITLPASPAQGRVLFISDANGNASPATQLLINGNGKLVGGFATYGIISANGSAILIYDDTSWSVF